MILVSSVEMGQGAQTTLKKIVAETLGFPLEQVTYDNPDTDRVPDSGPTVASRTVMVVGRLLERAAEELKRRWDDDEECTWEVIDTEFRNVEMDIELGYISTIRRKGCCSAIITLWDGHEFKVKGSNDVDDENKGIFVILDSGEEIEIDWEDFDYVEFK